MNNLASVDYWILFGYFAITLVVGMWMTKKASSSMDHYFLGGRNLPWWMLGVAGMTSWFDLTGTMIITSFLYMLGPRGLFIEFRGGAVLVLAFLLTYTGKWHRRSGCMTSAEWASFRYGSDKSADAMRLMSAVMGIVVVIGMLAYLVRGCTLFVGMFIPYPPLYVTLVLLGISAVYTMCAGFYGVILTDLVQGTIVLVACVIVSIMAWTLIGSTEQLQEIATAVTGNVSWTSSVPSFHTTMPKGYEAYESLFMFAMFYLACNLLIGMGTGAEPRYFAAKSDRECGLQSMLQGITVMFRWPMMIGFAILGLFLVHEHFPSMEPVEQSAKLIRQAYPDWKESEWHERTLEIATNPEKYDAGLVSGIALALGTDWQRRLHLVSYQGTVNPERILPAVILEKLPTGLKGFMLVAMLAALMSNFTGLVNPAGALFVRDIYQKFFRPNAESRELITASYFATLGVVGIGIVMGIAAKNINNLWGWIVMGLTAGMIAPSILRLYWWRFNAWGALSGMALGGGGALVQRLVAPELVEWKQFLIMLTLSFTGAIVGSLTTAPTPMPVLENFYRKTRPFGFWKPLKGSLDPETALETEAEHRRDKITVPFVLITQVSLFLLPMQLLIKDYRSFFCTLPIFLIGVWGLKTFWWPGLAEKKNVVSAGE